MYATVCTTYAVHGALEGRATAVFQGKKKAAEQSAQPSAVAYFIQQIALGAPLPSNIRMPYAQRNDHSTIAVGRQPGC
jgi:hypothetical protein